MVQIPIYRAKKINSDEYVEGHLLPDLNNFCIYNDWLHHTIDLSTLAIHFPDMIDSQGNKIFASLSEDGKGGTNLFVTKELSTWCVIYENNKVAIYEFLDSKTSRNFVKVFSKSFINFHDLKAIGIQQ